jgi:hypothetical protein
MSFEWLKNFQQNMGKPEDYAEKTLAAYRLGMKANGAISGVSITIDADGCTACRRLDPSAIYHPDNAPLLPLTECDRRERCGCIYRPVMSYQIDDVDEESTEE